jgi:flagellar assembly protein FliH
MLSSKRVLKPEMVNLDTENKVIIDIGGLGFFESEQQGEDDGDMPVDREEAAKNSAKNIIKNAEREAEKIISDAHITAMEKAKSITESAESEAIRKFSEAHEKGYNEGIDKATREGDEIKADAKKILDDAVAERKSMQDNLEPEVVDMIIRITEKLLSNTANLNPEIIINLVRQGFSASTISGDVVVHVSPDDYNLVLEKRDEMMAFTDGSVKLKIEKDLSLSPMDCVIETPMGAIDCSLGKQFETLKANLTYILNNK